MAIEKIYQNSTNTGTHTSSLGFVRKLNNNSEELGTTTKLNLKDRNTPELIKKAFREQAKNKINYATPGGPEYTMNRVVDGVVQIYNNNIDSPKQDTDIKEGDTLKVVLNEAPTKFTEAILKSIKEETYDMFPLAMGADEQSAFGFSINPFPLFANRNMKVVYAYIDENITETILLLGKTLDGFSTNGWYIVDQESLDPSETTLKLTSKIDNFKEINNLQFTISSLQYSNLNDESNSAEKINTSEFYDLIKSISVYTDNRIVTGGKYKFLINENPTEYTKKLLDSVKVGFKDKVSFYYSYEMNDDGVTYVGTQTDDEILNIPCVYFVNFSDGATTFYGYIDSNIIEMMNYVQGSSITGYTEPGWYKYTTKDHLAYEVEKANYEENIKYITLTISEQNQHQYVDESNGVVSYIRPILYKSYFYGFIQEVEEISVPANSTKIKAGDGIKCELNKTPIDFFNSLYDDEVLPMIVGKNGKTTAGNVNYCGIKFDAASTYNKSSVVKYLIYVTSEIITTLSGNNIDTTNFSSNGWYMLVENKLETLNENFKDINNFYIPVSSILSYKLGDLDNSTSLTEVNVSDFKDLFKTIYVSEAE